MQLPIDDKHTQSKQYLEDRLAILMGGRVAEEIFLGQITTGAGNDIERATDMARRMVCEFGMSDLGPMSFGKKEEQIFLGREINQHRDYSEETAVQIDTAVRNLVRSSYDRARKIIEDHKEPMIRVAEALLEREVLDGEDVKRLLAGGTLDAYSSSGGNSKPGDTQQVLRPEADSKPTNPGLMEGGSPQPA
jgi:cell division protease FtsH